MRIGERRPARVRLPAAAFLDPGRDGLRVGPGLAAQPGGLPCDRLVELALGCALEDSGHLGQQIAAPVRELAQLGHRRGFLLPGQLAPPGMMPGGAGELRDEDPVTTRARTVVSHVPSVADLYGKYAPDCQDTAPGIRSGALLQVRRPACRSPGRVTGVQAPPRGIVG